MAALAIPTIPPLYTGHVVTAAEATQLCSAASFLLAPPMTMILDETGGQAISVQATPTLVTFTNVLKDVDGAWNAGAPDRLTIQTAGWYKVRHAVNCVPAATGQAPFVTYLTSTTGANAPLGSGIVSGKYWGGYADGASSVRSYPGSAGIWPLYLYSGDFIQVHVYAQATGASTSATDPSSAALGGSFLSIEYVSTV